MVKYRKHILFIILVILIVFAGSLCNDFAWDDESLITENSLIKDWHCIKDIFTTQLYQGAYKDSNFYRPLQLLSFMLDYSVWKLNPFGYHLTSLLIHIFNSILVYLIVIVVSSSPWPALISSLMFGVCPVISGVVFYISARADLLMAMFLFLSFLFFMKYRETCKKRYYSTSILLLVLSILSKEMALILPFLLFIDISLRPKKETWLKRIKVLAPYFLIILIYACLRWDIFDSKLSGATFASKVHIWNRLMTIPLVLATYIRLLVFPWGLHMERFLLPVKSCLKPAFFIPVVILCFIFAVIKKLSRIDRIFLYGALWFFISLVPVLNIYPISVFLHEMWLYVPSLGFFIFISGLAFNIKPERLRMDIRLLLTTLYISCYCLWTVSYGKEWKDYLSILNNDLKYETGNPLSYFTHNNLSVAYYQKREYEKAIEHAKKSIAIKPGLAVAYNTLGVVYAAVEGGMLSSIKTLKKCVKLNKNFVSAYYSLANVYNFYGFKKQAIEILKKAIEIRQDNFFPYKILGSIYYGMGNIDKAIIEFETAEKLAYSDTEIYHFLGLSYFKEERYKEAMLEYEKIIKTGRISSRIYNEIADVYIKNKKFKEAETALLKSAELDSDQSDAYKKLGDLYLMFGYFDLAVEEYQKALKKEPNSDNDKIKKNIKRAGLLKAGFDKHDNDHDKD